MKLSIVRGATSVIIHLFIQDSASTTGGGKTGLAFNTASLAAYYIRPGDASATAISLATATVGTWATGGFKEVDATNMPGLYEFSVPDALLNATGTKRHVTILFKGAAGMAPLPVEIALTATDNQDVVRMGMTALPNAAAGASGGLWLMTSIVEGTKTVQQYLQWMASAMFGKLSGVLTNAPTFLSPSDGSTTRIAATTTADGRTTVVLS